MQDFAQSYAQFLKYRIKITPNVNNLSSQPPNLPKIDPCGDSYPPYTSSSSQLR